MDKGQRGIQALTRRWGWAKVRLAHGGYVVRVWFLFGRAGMLYTSTVLVNPDILRYGYSARRSAFAGVLRELRRRRHHGTVST